MTQRRAESSNGATRASGNAPRPAGGVPRPLGGAQRTSVGNYSATLGLTKDQVNGQAAAADYFHYVLACQAAMRNGAQQWSSWKTAERNGGTQPPAGEPMPPTFPPAVPAVPLGIEPRFRALVKLIKANANYNEAMGEALGIEGAQQAGPDLTAIQPNIEARISGTTVRVDWGWQGQSAFLDMIELQVDRAGGQNFAFLANDTTPATSTPRPSPPLRRNGPTAPSIASATSKWVNGASRSAS
jgi:hypothetical protein